MPRPLTETLKALAAIAAVLVFTTWPLSRDPTGVLMGVADIEAVEHLWTLWLGAREGPIVIDTDLAAWPDGYRWVLADPVNLLWFLPGLLLSPVLGFHLVQVCNLAMAGVVAALVGRMWMPEDPPPAWASAALAVGAAPLAGNLLTGMTEANTLWLAVLAVLLLDRALARGGGWTALAALAGGLSAWGGPYTAVYATLLAPVVLARRWQGATAARLGMVGLGAGLLALPVAWAITMERPEGLPGSDSMTAQVLATPTELASRYLGTDPIQLLLPVEPHRSPLVHASYLGLGALLLTLVGAWRHRPRRLLAALALCLVLGLGLYVQVFDRVPLVGGRPLLLPAGLLSRFVEPLGRASRWHRFLIPAAILLAPLAAAGGRALVARLPSATRGPVLALLVAGCVADQVLSPPFDWPRPVMDARLPPIYTALPERGPMVVVPKQPRTVPALPRSSARQLLWQTLYPVPIGERPMFPQALPEVHEAREILRAAARRKDLHGATVARQHLKDLGFLWIVHHDEVGNTIRAFELEAVLGPPDVRADHGQAWRL